VVVLKSREKQWHKKFYYSNKKITYEVSIKILFNDEVTINSNLNDKTSPDMEKYRKD
jgi:hypothetical protein